MRIFLIIISIFLLLAMADMPMGFYTLLRILVFIGSIVVMAQEYQNGLNFWMIAFILIGIIFNPLIPVYLHDKDTWMIIDLIAAVIFGIKAFSVGND